MIKDVQKGSNILFPEHLKAYNTNIHIADFHIGPLIEQKTSRASTKLPLMAAENAKKRKLISQLPLENRLIFQCFRLT